MSKLYTVSRALFNDVRTLARGRAAPRISQKMARMEGRFGIGRVNREIAAFALNAYVEDGNAHRVQDVLLAGFVPSRATQRHAAHMEDLSPQSATPKTIYLMVAEARATALNLGAGS